jgi:hypothetical protein
MPSKARYRSRDLHEIEDYRKSSYNMEGGEKSFSDNLPDSIIP